MQQPCYAYSQNQDEAVLMGGIGFDNQYLEVASQSWTRAALIHADANGAMAICTATSAIGGVAVNKATGVTGTRVHFRPIKPADVYIMNVYHATAASAITALTQVGDAFGMIVVNGRFHIDIEDVTIEDGSEASARVKIIGFPDKHNGEVCTIGDIYGLAYVTFLPFSIASDGAPMIRVLQFA